MTHGSNGGRDQRSNGDRSGAGEAREGKRREHDAPRKADEQASPEPERPETPDEEAGQSIQELDEPPQAEGPR